MRADPIHEHSGPGVRWSRNNAAEAGPGVLTPMAWAFFGRTTEVGCRHGFADLGLIPRAATAYPTQVDDRMLAIFHGRWALNAGVVRGIMGALPGVSGAEVERDILGYLPEDLPADPPPWRAPVVLAKAPRQLWGLSREAERLCAEQRDWWVACVGPDGPRVPPHELLREAIARFGRSMRMQAKTRMIFQGVSSQLIERARAAGAADQAAGLLAAGAGLAESDVADDLWLVAHDGLDLKAFLGRHGYHGPNSGDVAGRSWREDPRPIESLLESLSTSGRPSERRASARTAAEQAAADVIARVPARRRPGTRLALRLAPAAARNLERSKTSFLLALDGARAAVRGLGAELVADGRLDECDDTFFLLPAELLDGHTRDLRGLVVERRAAHREHGALEVPATWTGQPKATPRQTSARVPVGRVTGAGVSPGTVEGRVRVVLDPGEVSELQVGEILVAHTTDPSWVSLMVVAGGLVVDIGTAASHSAIVARELGIPCVIGTRTGTRDLLDGDWVLVDGNAGTVEVLGVTAGD